MKLHEVGYTIKKKSRRRLGRGGKRGNYSGRGQKGQRSRAGRNIRPAERDLIQRLPKLRGFRNKPKASKRAVLNVGDFFRAEKSQGVLAIDMKFLKEKGYLPPKFSGEVKILGRGNVARPLEIRGIAVSKSAGEKIEKAGGKVYRNVKRKNQK